jgi:hypothetical protein
MTARSATLVELAGSRPIFASICAESRETRTYFRRAPTRIELASPGSTPDGSALPSKPGCRSAAVPRSHRKEHRAVFLVTLAAVLTSPSAHSTAAGPPVPNPAPADLFLLPTRPDHPGGGRRPLLPILPSFRMSADPLFPTAFQASYDN